MPFTFSHPALILPLTLLPKKWYSLTGLVVGSLSPDFEYFLRMRIQSDYSHSWSGLLWFDLPLGVLLTFVFHGLVRNSLFANLPPLLSSRLQRYQVFNWMVYFRSHWFVVCISILIGASSHLLWDSFTHDSGYFVQTIPVLSSLVEIKGSQVSVLKLLQHGSTLLGAVVLCIALLNIPAKETINSSVSLKYWLTFILLTVLICGLRLLFGLDYNLYGHLIVTFISASLISLIWTPWLLRKWR